MSEIRSTAFHNCIDISSDVAAFDESEFFRSENHASTVKALANLLLAICIFVIGFYSWLEGKLSFNIPLLLGPIFLTVLVLVKSGHSIAGTRMLLWGMLLATMAGSYWVSGISTPSLYLLPIVTMSAFWLLSRREANMMFVIATINVSWQLYIQTHGWIPPIPGRPPTYYFLAIVCTMLAALLLGNAAAKNLINQYLKIRLINQDLDNNHSLLRQEIAERKAAEADLKRSEEQLRLVLEGAEQGFWDWDISAGTVERNKRWAEMLGYTYEEIKLTTQQWTDFIHPDDRDRAWRSINDVLEGRADSHKAEYRMLHKNGSTRWILDQANVMKRDKNGAPTRMSGTHTDITERKNLESITQRYRAIVESSNDAIIGKDLYGIVTSWNSGAERMFGYSADEMIGQSLIKLFPADLFDEERQILQRIHVGEVVDHFETRRVHKCGNLIDVSMTISPIYDETGIIIGASNVGREITEKKRAEEIIAKEKFLAEQALELAQAGHWSIDFSEGNEYYTSSPRLVEIFGDPPRENFRYHIMDDWYSNLLAADKTLAEATLNNYLAAVEGTVPRYDMTHPYKRPSDGQIVWVRVLGHVVRDQMEKATHVYGAVIDITQQKLFEDKLEYQAHFDYLTGVSNRGYFVQQAEMEIARAARYKSDLSIGMMDIDHFKQINDTYGHKVGDLVLKKLADVCQMTLREVDIIGRLGGEEFALLLPETSIDEAIEVAERVRVAIASVKIPIESGLPISFTVSIGISSMTSLDNNLDLLLNLADEGLYMAKNSGRNRVITWSYTSPKTTAKPQLTGQDNEFTLR